MRIVLFTESAEPGGAERVVVLLARGLARHGHAVAVATLEDGWLGRALTAEGLPPRRLASRRALDVTLPLRLAALLRRERAQLLHSHLLDSTFYGSLAARLARVPHLGTDHGDVHLPRAKSRAGAKVKAAAAFGTRFTAVSAFTADRLAALGVPAGQIEPLANPIPPAPAADAARRRATREAFGVREPRERHWLWLTAGMLRPVKDQRTLIAAFAAALARAPLPQTLVVAGEGPERGALESLIRQLGVEDRAVLAGFREDLPALMEAADGFVLPSVSEALPMALLEAATHGLLLVASRVGGIPEIVRDGDGGHLFAPGDADALAALLARSASDPAGSAATAARGRARVLERFAEDRVLDRYLALCRRAIGTAAGGGIAG